MKAFASRLHAVGNRWQTEMFGWSAEYTPERCEKPSGSKISFMPTSFWIGESGIWFYSLMGEHRRSPWSFWGIVKRQEMHVMDVKATLDEYPLCDVAILEHGFAPYMRDYVLFVEQNMWAKKPKGRYRIVFTHCVVANVKTTVGDETWKQSWEDIFADYERWKAEGEPEGFIWSVCWSNAYPGLEYVSDSDLARAWSERLGKAMHEIVVETEVFHIQLVFHDVRVKHVDDRSDLVDRTIIPLPPP